MLDLCCNITYFTYYYYVLLPFFFFYSNGEFVESFSGSRSAKSIISFMKKQSESPDRRQASIDNFEWNDIPSNVTHLSGNKFESYLATKDHVVVMFYAKCKFLLFSYLFFIFFIFILFKFSVILSQFKN